MNTGLRIAKFAGVIALCLGSLCFADLAQNPPVPVHKKPKKTEKQEKPELPQLPSGPTGKAVPQVPLDSIPAVAPQVDYQHGDLTINAPNSTLGDILRAVRKQTGADIDVPEARERVVTHLGPGPARQVIAELLNGSRFNYVILGSPADTSVLTRIVLVAKSPEPVDQNNPMAQQQQAAMRAPGVVAGAPEAADAQAEANDADATPPEENAEENNQDQAAAEAEQPTATPDQNGVKTPQQLLQEMQQRQLQMQQQMQQQGQPGQQPPPGAMQRPNNPQQNE